MSDAQTILRMIETLHEDRKKDPGAERNLNRAVALYLGWYYYTPSEAKEKWRGTWKRGAWIHPDDCTNGRPVFCQMHGTDVHRDIPNYIGSRDALKAIRPEGWLPFCGNRHLKSGDKPFYFGFVTNAAQVISEDLPTEELAELHAIIQAIYYERQTSRRER